MVATFLQYAGDVCKESKTIKTNEYITIKIRRTYTIMNKSKILATLLRERDFLAERCIIY